MKYNVTFSCGHTETISLYGPTAQREKEIDWNERYGDCSVCRAEKLKQRLKEANEKAAEADLPELKGSEKQIVWADTIREEFIQWCNNRINNASVALEEMSGEKKIQLRDTIQNFLEAKKMILTNKEYASWWIDNRWTSSFKTAIEETVEYIQTRNITPSKVVEEVKAECIVTPEDKKYNGVVEIKVSDNTISARYERNENFQKIVRQLHLEWDRNAREYRRVIYPLNGTVADRVAELGNKLLSSGFAVQIMDADLRNKAIKAEFEPECRRWVTFFTKGDHAGKFSIHWDAADDLFGAAKKIHGAFWDRPAMVVPMQYYDEVLDFANIHGFKISQTAQNAINAYKDSLNPPVNVAAPSVPQDDADKLKEILKSNNTILEDLRDD